MKNIEEIVKRYKALEIDKQIDWEKFYLYSIITHSTAIEGSTITETENQIIFDEGLSCNKNINEILMNIDLKRTYEKAFEIVLDKYNFSPKLLSELSSLIMKNTGGIYRTAVGEFDSSKGDIRLINVSSGRGGRSYLNFEKIEKHLEEFCLWLNNERKNIEKEDIESIYKLSFRAHFRLVIIHPFADGNGRLSRLVMNMIQKEFDLIPSIVKKEDRADYIKSLASSWDKNDEKEFINFMMKSHINNMEREIKSIQKQ